MKAPTLRDIAAQWNRNATARCQQVASGKDTSHDKVLVPTILRLAGNLKGMIAIDVGCGCGLLTQIVASRAKHVTGIDISQRMIEEARQRQRQSNVSFKWVSLQAFARVNKKPFDICVANMSVITMPRLQECFRAFGNVLKRNGALVFSIAHPCFWNSYRKDESIKRFDYWRSHAVTAPFRITSDPKALPTPTTYFHRPLSEYLSSVRQAGFQVEELVEPKPPIGAPKSYLHSFAFPRFMVLRVRKAASESKT